MRLNQNKVEITDNVEILENGSVVIIGPTNDGFAPLIAYSKSVPPTSNDHWDWVHKNFRK